MSESQASAHLPPCGGRIFTREFQLPVPHFFQDDPRWAQEQLGHHTDTTLANEGCAVACAAMTLAYFGIDTDPVRLNCFLRENNGFLKKGLLIWKAAAQLAPRRVQLMYAGQATHELLDEALDSRQPGILRVRYPKSGHSHFVVVVGKRAHSYLILDPGPDGRQGAYPLEAFGSPIEALRLYATVQ